MSRLPDDWRNRLPYPLAYYGRHVAKLGRPNRDGWAQGRCPFHKDKDASFSVKLTDPRGYWTCFAGCGHGDMVTLQMRLTGQPFADAARALLGGAA